MNLLGCGWRCGWNRVRVSASQVHSLAEAARQAPASRPLHIPTLCSFCPRRTGRSACGPPGKDALRRLLRARYPCLPKASLLEDHTPSIHTTTLASGRPPGGRGQAAEPPGASVSPSAVFCTKLNQIMRASPQNSIWRAVRHLTRGALIYYCLLSVRSSLRLSLLCQWFQMPQNHPGSFVEDTD